jgi:hypothetical protein
MPAIITLFSEFCELKRRDVIARDKILSSENGLLM